MAARNEFSRDNTGLVLALGGGGAAGIAHIGVLQVLEENAIPVCAVVGTGIDAGIGAFLAGGMPLAELADLATAFDWKRRDLENYPPPEPYSGSNAVGQNWMQINKIVVLILFSPVLP